tara:strand:- start:396 stop:548 length:153 start_codon:yes stop_codon:yes gene_type:complete
MPMKKAMPGGKVTNKGKYRYGGPVMSKSPKKKMMGGGMMAVVVKKNKKKK